MNGNPRRSVKLGDLFAIKHGYAFKGEHFGTEGSHIVLTPGNFFDEGGFKKKGDKEKWYSGKIPEDYILSRGDLIVAMTEQGEGLLGSAAIVPESSRYLHNQRLGLIQNLNDVNKRFLYYLFNSHPVRQQIRASCSGVKVRHTSPSRIYDVKVDIPPLPTQRKIAAILSAYDDMIENNLRRIKILEEMAQNLYREWFVKFRFPGYRYARFVDSPLGRIPEGWEVRGAMENNHWSFIHQNIGAYEGVKRYYATADIDGITITSNGIEYTYSQKPSRAQKQPLINSVWFARMQETYKMIAVAKPNAFLAANCMLSSGFAGFKAHDEDSFAFLFLTIKSKEFHLEKDRYCTGATQRSLTNDGLSRILTISPPRDIVQNFGRLAMRHVELILVLQQRNKILRRTRDLLLPKLISGEVDVSELDITVPEEVAT